MSISTSHLYQFTFGIAASQGPPHSIAVTPSRESLSMQEHTVATLKGLFIGFLNIVNGPFQQVCMAQAHTIIEKAVTEVRIDRLLNAATKLPHEAVFSELRRITDIKSMAERYMQANYPAGIEFRKDDISHRLNKMVEAKLLDRGQVQTYIRELATVTNEHELSYSRHQWLQRRVIAPLLAKLQAAKIDHTRLYVYDSADRNAPKSYYNKDSPPLVAATSASPTNLFNCLPYLKGIVVLSTSQTNLKDRIERHEKIKRLGMGGMLFYRLSMKKEEREAQMAFFEASGMWVVDLTVKQAWELPAITAAAAAPRAPRKAPKVGLPRLDSILNKNKQHEWYSNVETRLLLEEDAPRITQPEFVLVVSTGQKEMRDRIGRWDQKTTQLLIEMFGDRGAVTNNTAVAAKCVGVPDFKDYVYEKLAAFMMTNPNIQEYWAYAPNRVIEKFDASKYMVNAIYNAEVLRHKYKLVNNLTAEEAQYVQLWNSTVDAWWQRRGLPPVLQAAQDHLEAIQLAPANGALVSKMKGNRLIHLIDASELGSLLEDEETDDAQRQTAIDMLALALN